MLVGLSPEIVAIRKMIGKVGRSNENVLIVGEVGTGKQHVAQAVHQKSNQKSRPFITLNCNSIGDTITEKDLFGETVDGPRGVERKIGLIEQANKGFLYLDNVDKLPEDLQLRLHNILADKRFKRTGSNDFTSLKMRIVATTLEADLIHNEAFRRDLLSLISPITIKIPPLRNRKQDIPILFSAFLEQFSEEFDREMPPVPAEIFESLMEYEWFGNVGELKNAVKTLLTMSPETSLALEYLPFEIKKHPFEFLVNHELTDAVSEVERYLIRKTLSKFAGNQTKAARSLNISEAALRYKMKKYSLSRKAF